jgi:hypothetical protein
MAFQDLDEFFDDTLSLPVGGKVYVVPPATAEFGLYCQRLLSRGAITMAGGEVAGPPPKMHFDDDEEIDIYKLALGETLYKELLSDGVSWPRVQLIGQTAIVWIGANIAAAEQYWAGGGRPEASAPTNRAARRSTGSAGASKTRRPASTSGTRSRAASKQS